MKGYIFDLDGTLLDSMSVWDNIGIDFLKARGITPPPDYMDAIFPMSFEQSAAYTIARFGLPDSPGSLMRAWNEMAAHAYGNTVQMKPGAKEYLFALRGRGVRLAVATSLSGALYRPALRRHGIDQLFDVICGAEEVPCSKSRPDIFLLCARQLGLRPSECVVFEDLLGAVESAKSIGMRVIGVYDQSSEKDWARIKQRADSVIYSFRDAPVPE